MPAKKIKLKLQNIHAGRCFDNRLFVSDRPGNFVEYTYFFFLKKGLYKKVRLKFFTLKCYLKEINYIKG